VPTLDALEVADSPEVWSDFGFTVIGSVAEVDGVSYVLGAEGRGVTAWAVDGLSDKDVDGLPTASPPVMEPPPSTHPNGVIALDHLVISTPNLGRTIERFEAAGLDLRRTRDAGRISQAFFKVDEIVLEVVGPPQPAGEGPARFWGLAWTVADLDATVAFFRDRIHPAKEAVQSGRRIATLDKAAGSTTAHAFMSAEPL
jgi:glyoxalase/bleomycin resistance protein/dioxygenase superfamily protein